MEQYYIQIIVSNGYAEVECSSSMPFILADRIKEVVKDFYKEDK